MSVNCEQFVARGVMAGKQTPSDVFMRGGKISAVKPCGRGKANAGSKSSVIIPTLFDIQVNGVAGIDLQGSRVAPDDVAKITDTLARWGVSHWAPTLVTGPVEHLLHGCRAIAEALEDKRLARAVPGIHIEGAAHFSEGWPSRGA